MDETLLVINCGSSSLKLSLFRNTDLSDRIDALAERLGSSSARLRIDGWADQPSLEAGAGHLQALQTLIEALQQSGDLKGPPRGIGHRVVHGGESFHEPALINEEVIAAIEDCSSLAPLHNPANLTGIRATLELYPNVPQVAVFDTAFHQTIPPRAFRYALPRRFYEDLGVRRYGFHGTSHAYLLGAFASQSGKTADKTSIISAHLGNGCSICAINNGESQDISMGLTPLEGLVMGTRSGDVDPGLFEFAERQGIDAQELTRILNNESGLAGLSELSNDMRTIVESADQGNEACQLAIEVFCFRLARYIGAMMASLSQLDGLVFTGGIGENSARIRSHTVAQLSLRGFELDENANRHHGKDRGGRIEAATSRFPIAVIATDEESMIASAALKLSH